MKRKILGLLAVVVLSCSVLRAQDIAGDWQGTLESGPGFRIVITFAKNDLGRWKGELYSIDIGPDGVPINSLSLHEGALRFSLEGALGGDYEGQVNADGSAIIGKWTQGKTTAPLNFKRATKETAWQRDASPEAAKYITVAENVKLEVLDWGGTGRPIVLLAGLGNTAHIFDKFAPKLTSNYHVYGITRRGFGNSSSPAPENGNYSADRLGDDVVAVLDTLKLKRPILVGHSIAGEELSSIGSRYPGKVGGLIYLDAGYAYAFYDRTHGDLLIDSIELKRKLDQLIPGIGPADQKPLIQELQQMLPQFQKDLQDKQKALEAIPVPPQGVQPAAASAILAGQQEYTDIRVPVLAIFAVPHDLGSTFQNDPAARTALEAFDVAHTTEQANAFEKGIPSAHVVRLAHASHFVFISNEADVLREMNVFISSLPDN
jgi:non-heme chloroperoxidase